MRMLLVWYWQLVEQCAELVALAHGVKLLTGEARSGVLKAVRDRLPR
jgi:hypothetical protein